MSAADSVLLIAFGGPEKPEDIRPFLQLVTTGRPIPPDRIEEVAHHYEAIGGRSPLNELTFKQAGGLRRLLKRDGGRALGIILSSFQAEASWERYLADVAAAREKVGPGAPEVAYAPAWFDHPRFIEAVADRVAETLGRVAPEGWKAVPVVFTAHSVPAAMADGSPYVAQFTAAARAVAASLNHQRWSVAYQSRSGAPREPWLEPDVAEVLRQLAKEGVGDVVVAPIGFVCDHVEVLYDQDVEARQLAEKLGVHFHRAEAVNDHPAFVEMLADLARAGLGK